ncbi:MAG: MFS transporter [Candidatus Thorarchaeota archaeon]
MVYISTPLDNDSDITDRELKKKTMQISITEGCFGVFSSALVDNYIVPFSISINLSPFQVGILTSLGNLISPLGQIIGSRRIESKPRRKVLLTGILGQASIWPLFLLIAVLFQFFFVQSYFSWILIIVFIIYMLFAGVMTPPWFSLMGDIVPEDYRGRYFAKRNLITQLIAFLGIILLSFILDWFASNQAIYIGFTFIFIFGLVSRLISAFLFTKHYYPPLIFEKTDHIKISNLFKEFPKSNFGRFTLFVSLLTLGQWIAKPFFSVYMLTQLKFDYSLFIFINLSSTLIGLITFPLLGKFSDKFGNVRLIQMGSMIIPFLPFFWIIYKTPLHIFLGIQILSGIAWTAYNLATANFIYDNITSKRRGSMIAIYNFLIGIATLIGGFLGSFIISFIPIRFMNSFHFIFLLSGVLRMIVVVVLLRKIKEVRIHVKPIFNVKNLSINKWLYDITLRSKILRKKKS